MHDGHHDQQNPSGRPPRTRPAFKRMSSTSGDLEGSFVLIYNQGSEVLDFDPAQSHMIAFAIDKQTDPKFSKRQLTYETVLDAKQVCKALINKGVVPYEQVQLLYGSKHEELCTLSGMEESFMQQAQRAGPEGIFVFHFSGHGLQSDTRGEWGLAPVDFAYSRLEESWLTSAKLGHWLVRSKCKAKYVLFILDCCYAGGLGQQLTMSVEDPKSGLYVLSACTAYETSLVLGPLGHSIFTYFMEYAINKFDFPPGKLPISKIIDECATCSVALSSLLLTRDQQGGLQAKVMQPELKFFDVQESLEGYVLNSLRRASNKSIESHVSWDPEPGRYDFVTRYFRNYTVDMSLINYLCVPCMQWIAGITFDEDGKLRQLVDRGLCERPEVVATAVCCMMWSVAYMQLAHNPRSVSDPDIFLLGFLHCATVFDHLGIKTTLSLATLSRSLAFYQEILERDKMDQSAIVKLMEEIKRDLDAEDGPGEHAEASNKVTIFS